MDEAWMCEALNLAREALLAGETPVGCVIVRGGEIVARARNRREELGDPTAHAEMLAIREAARKVGNWRLADCCIYVTLEPCPMCAGAAINAHVERIVYGAEDEVMGACGTAVSVIRLPRAFRPALYKGLLGEECGALLRRFFAERRK